MTAFFNSPDAGSLTIEVYGFDDPFTRLNYIPRFEEASFMDELKNPGGGSVTLRSDDFKFLETPALLDRRNIVKCRYGNKVVAAFIVQSQEEVYVDKSEGRASAMTYAGESLKSWFRDASLYADGGFKSDSYIGRPFSFASTTGPWYNSSDWSPAVNVTRRDWASPPNNWGPGSPEGWPDEAPHSYWVWKVANGYPDGAPAETVLWRYAFNIAAGTGKRRYKLSLSADNTFDAFLNGQSLGSGTEWNSVSEFEFELSPGDHVIALETKNLASVAGIIFALSRSTTAGEGGTYSLIYESGQPGLVWYNKPGRPGWTPGQILRVILEEAAARGVLFPKVIKPTFTDDKDSNGVDWLPPLDWSWNLGTSYLEILESLEEVQCESWIDPDTYEFHVYVDKGRNLQEGSDAVQIRAARNINQAVREAKLSIKNAVLVNAEGLWVEQDHPDSVAKYGRIEGYLQTELAAETSRTIAAAILKVLTDTTRSLTVDIIPSEFAVPFLDFSTGDWVSVTDPRGSMEKDRVVTIAVTANRDEPLPQFSIELNTASEDQLLRLSRIISRMSRGSLGGNTINSLV